MSHDTPLSFLTDFERNRAQLGMAKTSQVKMRLEMGVYKTEEVPCFCGASEYIQISTLDRYKLPHRMVLCSECALIRTNPRMTAESYEKFYNDEYRLINTNMASREAPLRDAWDEIALYWVLEVKSGEDLLKAFLDQGRPAPKKVLDFGCHYGGAMQAFRDKGAECFGIEFDLDAVKIAEERDFTVYRTLDEAIEHGIKVDFIIMQDIIEHLTDLRGDLTKISRLLTDDGVIHVWTPGLFGPTVHLTYLFQMAHTYQFCGHTLDYVMNTMGFEPMYLDEVCSSFWRRKIDHEQAQMPIKPVEWVEYTLDQLNEKKQRRLPQFKSVCKFTRKERYENIRENCKHHIPDLQDITEKYSGSLMIVGGGPSVNSELETMKELYAKGMPVMAIARMYPWCVKNGLGPTFVASMDSMEEQEKGFENINSETIHLMCSVTRPSLFKDLPKGKVFIWDNMDDIVVRNIRREAGYTVATCVQGGGSVTVSSLSLGMNLGFADFHIFGADCMFPSKDQTHAEGIAGDNVEYIVEEVTIAGKTYLSTAAFVMFAKQFLDMVWAGYTAGLLRRVKFYGECLINKMWDGKFLTEKEMQDIEKETADGN